MSRPLSALGGVAWDVGLARIEDAGLQGMITVRGDLDQIKDTVEAAASVEMPGRGGANLSDGSGLCWMSPDELLLLCPYDEAADKLAKLQDGLAGSHALAVIVSDARSLLRVKGDNAREVMAKLAPVDLAPGQFEPGMIRRTRLGQAAAAFWMPDAETFHVICFRSHATYVFDLLRTAAQPKSVVAHF
ncbi:MAG: sarcosine oxidase subunit gamma family protein [Pseudomonadota bacterium]